MKRELIIVLGILGLAIGVVQAQEATEGKMVAWANLEGTNSGSSLSGEIRFYEIEGGLKAVGNIAGVQTAGKHGMHIHENGNCEEAGNAAGSHYNPHAVMHGYLPKDGLQAAHVGDMGNVEIGKDGSGTFTVELKGVSVDGENAIDNKAIILHEKEDDFGQPTGNAGGRIGCGIIESGNDIMGTEKEAPMPDHDHEHAK